MNELKVGKRYIYFTTGGGEEYQRAITTGYQYLSSLKSALQSSSNTNNSEELNKILIYINFIKSVAETERNNEINFIKQLNNYLDEKILGKELKQHITTFLQTIETGEFNYMQLMSILNDYMNKNAANYKEQEALYLENMRIIDMNYQKLKDSEDIQDQEMKQEIDQAFESHTKSWLIKQQLTKNINAEDKTLKFNDGVTKLMATRFNEMMSYLSHHIDIIKPIIVRQLSTSGLDSSEILSYICALAYNWISKLDLKTLTSSRGSSLAEQFTLEISNNIEDAFKQITPEIIKQVEALLSKKQQKNIAFFEEIILTTDKSITDLFESLSDDSKKQIISLDKKNLLQLYENYKKDKTAINKSKLSRGIKKAITERLTNLGFIMPKGNKNQIRARIKQFIEMHSDVLGIKDLDSEIKNAFKVTTIGGSIGEYFAAHSQEFLKSMSLGGGKSKFKTDMSVAINFNPNGLNFNFLNENETTKELTNLVENFIPEMLAQYKKSNLAIGNASEQTDVQVAISSYRTTMYKISTLIKKLEKENNLSQEQREELMKRISEYIQTSISVKDYNTYINELGFHGGSLGAGHRGFDVLKNIDIMYKTGGITPIDRDLLMFGVLNCIDMTIGGTELKEDLQNYLLGGAAMIMFDDGFTAAKAFLDKIKSAYGFTMASLHLYRLQSKYVPASYIYTAIYNNLCTVYADLVQITSNIIKTNTTGGQVHIKNSMTVEQIINHGNIQQRWDKTAKLAENSTSITFSFMANLLDVFEQIPQAFNLT